MKIELFNQVSFQAAEKAARAEAKKLGINWVDAEVFAMMREKGRYAIKSAGRQTMQAGG